MKFSFQICQFYISGFSGNLFNISVFSMLCNSFQRSHAFSSVFCCFSSYFRSQKQECPRVPERSSGQPHLALISWWWGLIRRLQGGAATVVSPRWLCGLPLTNMKPSGLFVVFLLLCADRRSSGNSHPKPSCRYPPSQWCRSLKIAIECKVSGTITLESIVGVSGVYSHVNHLAYDSRKHMFTNKAEVFLNNNVGAKEMQ